jgi:hypothetical protein
MSEWLRMDEEKKKKKREKKGRASGSRRDMFVIDQLGQITFGERIHAPAWQASSRRDQIREKKHKKEEAAHTRQNVRRDKTSLDHSAPLSEREHGKRKASGLGSTV